MQSIKKIDWKDYTELYIVPGQYNDALTFSIASGSIGS
jgi:hypothetical protein